MLKKKQFRGKFYRLNQYIEAAEFRLVNDRGEQIGILKREEALEKAREEGLDLVEVAAEAKPPVVKLVNFKKFLYLEAKKQKGEKKVRGGDLKEIRLTPFIGQADFNFRLKRAEEFLKEGNKVKVTVVFKGRQITRKEFGQNLLVKFCQALSFLSRPEYDPKLVGKSLFVSLTPLKGGKDAETQNKKISE